jgi:radical SAM protein with 4Fe4S-binding SPASM domain
MTNTCVDTNLNRKSQLIDNPWFSLTGDYPLFSIVEFNITELCNRRCSFCPRYDSTLYPNINEHISLDNYNKIMSDLRRGRYNGNILYSAFGEPLLHPKLSELIKSTKKHCPDCHLEIITNGDFVTNNNIMDLFNNGLDTLLFSLYDGEHQIEQFNILKKDNKLDDNQMRYRKRYGNEIILSNRAGLLPSIEKVTEPKNTPCFYPFYQVTVDVDGSVLFCPHNWKKTPIMGNAIKDNIIDIWNNQMFKELRMKLIDNNRNFKPCKECNVLGNLMGNEYFNAWVGYYGMS